MNDEKEKFFTVTDEKGKATEYEILFTFDSDETKKSYIVFTDNTEDDAGSLNTYAATYNKDGNKLELKDIKTDKEWDLIENLLSQFEDKMGE
ncbi:MAG: DUF1292 domain-containing protein [Bacilli bacterium]|jgi:uncharacterized protein YrzB (UPF0473 family)|nr:DUF1292 domain-containing protein [Bacilli bacterium]MCX4253949.1 DUF1292 domain-containing protein [Bacilli bacterium]